MEAEMLKKQECETLLNKIYEEIEACKEEIQRESKRLFRERIIIPESDFNILHALECYYNGKVQHFSLYIHENIQSIEMKKHQLAMEFDLSGEEQDLLEIEISKLRKRREDFEKFAKGVHDKKFITYQNQSDGKLPISDCRSFFAIRETSLFAGTGGSEVLDDTPCYSIYFGIIHKVEDEDKRNALFDSLERITKFLLKTNLYTPKKLDEYMVKEFKKVFGGE